LKSYTFTRRALNNLKAGTMMKNVYLIRHAKSSWKDMSLRDIERPLNKRGLRDAPFMAKMLAGKGVIPDAIISSPANRAFTTATYFAAEMGFTPAEITVVDTIYEAYTETILELMTQLKPAYKTVLIFGHNPTFTDLANRFTEDYIPNVPTCGMIHLSGKVANWEDFTPANAQLETFHYPKEYFD